MAIKFFKFQGAGNDFILFDDRNKVFEPHLPKRTALIKQLCNRNFGIGADGLMLLRKSETAHFEMQYFNSDGLLGSFCGNGARCIVAFANHLGLHDTDVLFMASDGIHAAKIQSQNGNLWDISVQMADVVTSVNYQDGEVVNTGSPHVMVFTNAIDEIAVLQDGNRIRNDASYQPAGVNVNFVQIKGNDTITIRTYERGVENETLACGTGATAAAIAAYKIGVRNSENAYTIEALGGQLKVKFSVETMGNIAKFTNIWLSGPAQWVFTGQLMD
ncbi:MAG TPA: diaminopimelate epimerase [Bacteroidales bacterium]|nr:diaminopimelate epimerase [Bacteroidales bacterium]